MAIILTDKYGRESAPADKRQLNTAERDLVRKLVAATDGADRPAAINALTFALAAILAQHIHDMQERRKIAEHIAQNFVANVVKMP